MNRKMLIDAIKTKGKTISEFCTEIGMSRTAFYRKSTGKTQFTLSEIKKIISHLDIKNPEDVFFCK